MNSAAQTIPGLQFVARLRLYLAEMYPLPMRYFSSFLMYGSFATMLRRLHDLPTPVFSPDILIGSVSLFLFLLLLRLMDELKDRDVDAKLFPHRPLPSGKILESDLRRTMVAVAGVFLVLNAVAGQAFWVALAAFLYALLMFQYFFFPVLHRRSLLLTVATHNPVIPLLLFYAATLVAQDEGLRWNELRWHAVLLLIVQYWAMAFAWEIARKIRPKEDENEYETYSRIFGQVLAVAIAATAQTLTIALGIYFYFEESLSVVYLASLIIGYAFVLIGHCRFLLAPSVRTSRLRPFAEVFMIIMMMAGLTHIVFGG